MNIVIDPSLWEILFDFGDMRIVFSFKILVGTIAPIIYKALAVGLLTSVCAAMLGVPLVLKRYSMIGDGLSHTGFFSLAIAAAFGVAANAQIYLTLPIVVIVAVVLLLLSESGRIKGDSAIAMISTGAVAIGYIIYTVSSKGAGDVCSSLFGTAILALKMDDVILSLILAAGVVAVFVLLYNKIFAVTFDPAFSRSAGSPVMAVNILLAALTAVTIVVGMKMIGAIMISALIVFPALSAMRVCKRFKSVIITSAAISAGCFVVGLFFATVMKFQFRFNAFRDAQIPVGPCVVAVNILAMIVCVIISRVRVRKAKKRACLAQKEAEK